MGKKYLNIEESAGRLGITPQEMRELRNRGEITGVPDAGDWKFDVDDVNELCRSREPEAVPVSTDGAESADSPEVASTANSARRQVESPKTTSDILQLRQELLARRRRLRAG